MISLKKYTVMVRLDCMGCSINNNCVSVWNMYPNNQAYKYITNDYIYDVHNVRGMLSLTKLHRNNYHISTDIVIRKNSIRISYLYNSDRIDILHKNGHFNVKRYIDNLLVINLDIYK